MELNHAQFWRITPAELLELYDGYQWRNDQEWIKRAWQTANIMNSTGKLKKPADPMKMLKGIIKTNHSEKPPLSKAEQSEELRKLKRDIDGKNND